MAAGFEYCVQVDKACSHGARASQGSAQGWTPLAAERGSQPLWRNTLLVGDRPNKLLETFEACLAVARGLDRCLSLPLLPAPLTAFTYGGIGLAPESVPAPGQDLCESNLLLRLRRN